MDCMLNRRIVSGGSGGLTGFTLKFPATATNWSGGRLSYIIHADGSCTEHLGYSTLANQQFENVVSIAFSSAGGYYMFKATLEKGSMLYYISRQPNLAYTTVAPGTLQTPMGDAGDMIYILLSDVTFSAVEMYNTD